jgi:hypothetical protein
VTPTMSVRLQSITSPIRMLKISFEQEFALYSLVNGTLL